MNPITDIEYKMYVDLNLVYETRLSDIAIKIISGTTLDLREMAIFEGKTKEINERIRKIKSIG